MKVKSILEEDIVNQIYKNVQVTSQKQMSV